MTENKETSFAEKLLWLSSFVKPYRKWLALSIITSFLCVACDIAGTYLIKQLIDNTVGGYSLTLVKVAVWCGVMIVTGIISNYFNVYATGRFASKTIKDIRGKITNHFGKLPISYIDSSHSGEKISQLTNDVSALEGFLMNDYSNIIYLPLIIICSFTYMAFLNWKLLLVSFIPTPVAMFLVNKLCKPAGEYTTKYFENLGDANSIMQDTIGGIAVVKSFQIEKQLYKKMEVKLSEALKWGLKMEVRSSIFLPLIILQFELPYILCSIYGGHLALNGQLQVGSLVAFIQLLRLIVGPTTQVPRMLLNIRSNIAIIDRLLEVINIPGERDTGEPVAKDNNVVLEFKNVTFGYDTQKDVLRNISFKLVTGETTAIVGPSGCGKSTVINLICGFYQFNKGCISLYGKDMSNFKLASIREHLSVVSQETFLFPGTIEENIRYGKPSAKPDDVVKAAKSANAHEFIDELPDGYNTVIGERGIKLSGGQCQRICIARAILKDAPLLVLDEPTSALDTKSESQVLEAIEHLSEGKTVLVIAHRLSTIKKAHKILVMNNGHIVEEGNHNELISQDGMYKLLYSKQNMAESIQN